MPRRPGLTLWKHPPQPSRALTKSFPYLKDSDSAKPALECPTYSPIPPLPHKELTGQGCRHQSLPV